MWIRGDPGKGKTMLMCGIIDYITEQIKGRDAALAYFFCQASDDRLNNSKAVLRGLNYMLLKNCKSSASHDKIIRNYGDARSGVFNDVNAWYALGSIMESLLEQSSPFHTYIVIDGPDECVEAVTSCWSSSPILLVQPLVSWYRAGTGPSLRILWTRILTSTPSA